MTPLGQIIADIIQKDGPMRFDTYMEMCLGHPQYGYYMSKNPFGVHGDFTTAPEISQIFGELLGVWVADTWIKMGSPDPFILCECGPGRGTLMQDALRATKNIDNFHQSVEIHLLENSDLLQAHQKQKLDGCEVHWHHDLETLPTHAPIIFIGNEFLDALVVRQFQFTEAGWVEKYVDFNKNGTFHYVDFKGNCDDIVHDTPSLFTASLEDHLEVSLQQKDFIGTICKILQKQYGMALFIDYGHASPLYGQTVQAVMNHECVSPLEYQGEADITAHVNFARLGNQILENDMTLYGPTSQSAFLSSLGANIRAGQLKQNATSSQAADIDTAMDRLMGTRDHKRQMGQLFKVMAFGPTAELNIEGFS